MKNSSREQLATVVEDGNIESIDHTHIFQKMPVKYHNNWRIS